LEDSPTGAEWEIEMVEQPQIYNLKLHEICLASENAGLYVIRVPGGWIYYFRWEGEKKSAFFVPFHNEFQNANHPPRFGE
jgi:hypothetical protein